MTESVAPRRFERGATARALRSLIAGGAELRPSGTARRDPPLLLTPSLLPKHEVDLFDTQLLLTDPKQTPELRFFVCYVVQHRHGGRVQIFPRIFYKDISLVWRAASHRVLSARDSWIGKGDVRTFLRDGRPFLESVESTTDLPLELQTALELVLRRAQRVGPGERALELVLQTSSRDRIQPYAEFTAPRRRAERDPGQLINGGKRIARFRRKHDPTSLTFSRGFEPDFGGGVAETARTRSTLYGGSVRRFRVVSRNRRVQYLFLASPRHAWMAPPQSFTRHLTSFALRPVGVAIDDDLAIPGYEYHFMDDSHDPPRLHSQIPPGYAGPPSPLDPLRCDASRWIEALPVIREFRRECLGQG